MRQELENRNIVFNFNANWSYKSLNIYDWPGVQVVPNNTSDVDIGKYNIVHVITEKTNYNGNWIKIWPCVNFSFTNQYVEDDIWYYDFSIDSTLDWVLPYSTGGPFNLSHNVTYDWDKLLWPNNTMQILAFGHINGFNPAWSGDNRIFTVYSYYNGKNTTWIPVNNSYYKVNSNYNNQPLNAWKINFNYPNYNSGIPIVQGPKTIYQQNNCWQPVTNNNQFNIDINIIYRFTDTFSYDFKFWNYVYLDGLNLGIRPTTNRNYDLTIYFNEPIINGKQEKKRIGDSIFNLRNKIIKVQKRYPEQVTNFISLNNGYNWGKGQHFANQWYSYLIQNSYVETVNANEAPKSYPFYKGNDLFFRPLVDSNRYNLVIYNYNSNDYNNYNNFVLANYLDKINLNKKYINDIPSGYHLEGWYIPVLNNDKNNIIEPNTNLNLNYDWPHEAIINMYGIIEKNTHNIVFKLSNVDTEPYYQTTLNHNELILLPNAPVPVDPANNIFGGWRFKSNNTLLINKAIRCKSDYEFIASWQDLVHYNVTYTFLNGKGNRNSFITDKWNIESSNYIQNQDVTYLKQMNTWIDTVKYWRDIDTNLFYYPGQRVDHALNLVYECDVDNNADWKNIITVPISFLDYSSVNNIKIENGYSYNAELMSAEFLNTGGGSPVCSSFNDIFYVNNSSNILNSTFKWNILNTNNNNGMNSLGIGVSKNLIELGQGSVYNNLTSTASFSPYLFYFCIVDDEYVRSDNNWDLENNGLPIFDTIGSCWLTNPYRDITFNNIWNFFETTNFYNSYSSVNLYQDSEKNNYGFLVFASSVRPLYMLGADWHNLSKRYDQILPVPFKAGYKFNGWWYNKSQFTDGNGKCLVAQFSSLYNIIFPNRVDKPWPDFEEIDFFAEPSESYYGLNNVFYPEFINLKNDFKHHFPYVLVNRNAEENVNFFDYSRIYTTKWLNNYTTFNNSYYFPSQLVPYQE